MTTRTKMGHHHDGHSSHYQGDRRPAPPEAHAPQSHLRDDEGMATAEYALVTVAAAGFAGLLIVLLKSPEVRELLMGIVQGALGG